MARVHFVQRARKANRKHHIKKGASYYWWKFRTNGKGGGKRYSTTAPRRSQLTQSEFLRAIHSAEEDLEDALGGLPVSGVDEEAGLTDEVLINGYRDDIKAALEGAKSLVEEQKEACEEKISAIQDRFPNGCPTIDLLERRVESCETIADDIEAAISTLETVETFAEIIEAVDSIQWECE